MHDKKITDEYPLQLPVSSVLRQDLDRATLGFMGHHPVGVCVEVTHKKPKNGTLGFSQLLYNQVQSPPRVVIEPVKSGIKRLGMIKPGGRSGYLAVTQGVVR